MDRKDLSLLPIYLERADGGGVEQIGSAVLITVGSADFLLTAAHVLDARQHGTLLVPTNAGLDAPTGYYAAMSVPPGRRRVDDTFDAAYVRLDAEFADALRSEWRPLSRSNLRLTDEALVGDVYSVRGYPHRRSRSRRGVHSSDLFSYSGHAAHPSAYGRNRYLPEHHVVVEYRRKRARGLDGQRRMPPLPNGVSGGGIFGWPKDRSLFGKRDDFLVGIFHTYLANQHLLVGTRLHVYLEFISYNNPEGNEKNDEAAQRVISMLTGVVWYREEDWDELLKEADDEDTMCRTWEEWREGAEHALDQLARMGRAPIAVEVSAEEIREFCMEKGLPNVGKSRIHLISEIMADAWRETRLNGPEA